MSATPFELMQTQVIQVMKKNIFSPCRTLSLLVVPMMLVVPASAFAQAEVAADPAPEDKSQTEASARFERGLALYREGALEAALVEFERAYELTGDYRVLFNLAQLQSERHHYAEAIEIYEHYLKDGGEELSEDRRLTVEADVKILRTHVARLWVESNVDGAELFVDDRSLGTLPLSGPVMIDSGLCKIRLESPGYASVSQSLKVAGGESPRVTLTMSKAGSSAPVERESKTEVPDGGEENNYTPFWISAGTTLVLGGTAAVFGGLTIATNNKLDDEFDRNPPDEDEVSSLQSRGKTYSWVADGFAIGSAVAAGVSLYFLINPPKSKSEIEVGEAEIKFAISPWGAHLHGSF